MVMSCFQGMRPDCSIGSFYTTGTQEKIDCFNVDGFCAHCNTLFEAMGCFQYYCLFQEARLALSEEDIQRGTKKGELDERRKQYVEKKSYTVVETLECDWWKLH